MMKKTKFYSMQIILLLLTIYTHAQVPATIVKGGAGGAYTVTGTETLIATQSIVLSPTTHIKAGSIFTAKISPDAYIPLFAFSNENFVFTRKYQTALLSSENIVNNSDVLESITYHDGLGRPLQSITIKGSPSKSDIVKHMAYNNIGIQEKEYLPYMDDLSSTASYRNSTDAETRTNNYYKLNYPQDIDNTLPNPFSQKKLENTPLNRVLLQAAPGKDWALNSGHEIKFDYRTNNTSDVDQVKLFVVTTTINADNVHVPAVTSTINYPDNQLYKTIKKDENWVSGKNNTTEEFKNKEGQVILKRNYSNYTFETEAKHDTYYIYDTYGNLTYVLPPKAEGSTSDPVLKELCYQYRYDTKNRLVEKKLPGKEWEYIVYDKLDRPILTQDANLRALNKWLFTKFDAFGRPIYTGEYINTVQTTRALVQTEANKSTTLFESKSTVKNIKGTNIYYPNTAFPTADIDIFTINYYDDYSNIDLDGGTTAASYGITPITNAKGLSTCTKVRILDTSNWITNVTYYDAKGRNIYTYSKNNYLTTTATVKTKLDFAGKVLETTSTQKKGTDPLITIVDVYSYDHIGRLLIQKQSINSQAQEIIANNTYDNLGQLVNKGVGGKTTQSRLQNVDFSYNIRGWLKNINNINSLGTDLFAFQINYNTATSTPDNKLFNGNISQTFWKTASPDNSLKNYTYTYDNLSRLTKATDVSTQNSGRYNENISYDKNGNIMSIDRKGNTNTLATTFGNMDILAYTYDTGNKLTKVEDTSGSTEGFNNGSNTAIEYTYDSNGNMKTDSNKNITAISYNHLNLPTSITLNSGTINYFYDATGTKQRKTISTGGSTDYAGSFIYENNILKQFVQPEGYVAYNSGIYNYIYQYKDHLGNNRLSYQDKDNNGVINSSEIVQENNYYAFGLIQKGYNTAINGVDNKYKYNGKELQDELGLNFYDYGARNYDPALGRWMNFDPLAENSRRWTPYNYAYDNPIYFVDPDGMESEGFRYDEKQLAEMQEDNKKFVQWVNNGGHDDNEEIDPPSKKKVLPLQGRYVTQGIDESLTDAIQWLSSQISGDDVSKETAENIQLVASVAIVIVSKGKNEKADVEVAEQVAKKVGIETSTGIKITGFGKHSLNRAIGDFARKGVQPKAILDAIKNPLVVKDVITDGLGRQSQRFIGIMGEVVVNPTSGKIISVNPTSSSKAAKLLKQIKQ